jgi:uncharacterized circularly permuted ATP-grasp superfamily protein
MDQRRAVIFRFGYLENFTATKLDQFQRWADFGATLINPLSFILDSKVIMASLGLPEVRQALSARDATVLPLLDRHVPPTLLLEAAHLERLEDERAHWIIKYAGFDGSNQAWGGRSLVVGAEKTADAWRSALQQMLGRPWPVVAQRLVPSLQQDIAYLNSREQVRWLRDGQTRLRAFFLRHQGEVRVSGAHVTLTGSGIRVSEGREAVQAPVLFM